VPAVAGRREWIARLALLAASLVIGLAVAEAAARRSFRPVGPGPAHRVEFQGTRLRFVSEPDGVAAIHTYNGLGYRDRDWSDEPGRRVGCYGDSFTQGMGVADGRTWPDALGRRLGPGWTVLNLGEIGTAPHGYAANVAATVRPLRVTHVVVALNSGDLLGARGAYVAQPDTALVETFDDGWAAPRWARPLPGLWAGWRAFRGSAPPLRQGDWWQPTDLEAVAAPAISQAEHVTLSAARRLSRERLADVRPECVAAARQGRFNPWNVVHLMVRRREGPSFPDVERSLAEWMAWLGHRLRDVAAPVIVYFPDARPEGPLGCWQGGERDPWPSPERLREMVARAAAQAGMPWIDASAALASAGAPAYLRYDGHPTEVAHEVVGALVAEHLARP
jgi:hypothetical protein